MLNIIRVTSYLEVGKKVVICCRVGVSRSNAIALVQGLSQCIYQEKHSLKNLEGFTIINLLKPPNTRI
jgi:protein-tyrosine phosphatase